MKISTLLQFDRAASQMGKLTGELAQQQARISSGEAFLAPREAPQAATTLLRLDGLKTSQASRLGLLDRAEARASTQEAALRSASDILIRIKEIAIQAGNGTYNAADRQTFALEVRALNDELLSLANTQDAEGNAVFAGAATAGAAFERGPDEVVRYVGDSAGVELDIGGQRRLNIARPGTTYFGSVPVPEGPRILSNQPLQSVAVSGGVAGEPGSYQVEVTQLAQAQVDRSQVFPAGDVALNGGEPLTLTIAQADGTITSLAVSSPTPEAVVTAINESDLGLSARLRVTDADLGTVALEVTSSSGESSAFSISSTNDVFTWTTEAAAQNSRITVNGEVQEGSANVLALDSGLSLALRAVGPAETFEVRTRDGFFTVLESFAQGLEANLTDQARPLTQLETMLEGVSLGLARVGTDLSAVSRARDVMAEEQLQTDALISDLRDLDFAEAITKLRADQLALEAAQSSFARIAGQSLFDFLR